MDVGRTDKRMMMMMMKVDHSLCSGNTAVKWKTMLTLEEVDYSPALMLKVYCTDSYYHTDQLRLCHRLKR